jgi:protein-tyrosine phosphatase
MGFVDLHAHFLPALDDGSPDLETSMAMLRGLADLGYERVTATPHQLAHRFMPTYEAIDTAFATVDAERARQGIGLALSRAAENMWDDVFFSRVAEASFPRYDGGPAFLFELRLEMLPPHLDDVLFRLQTRGLRPVLAHPERYVPFQKAPDRLEALADRGIGLLVDLGALTGHHGRHQEKAARRLVESGVAHAVASDAHNREDVKIAGEAIAWIRRKLGLAAVSRLCDENPRRLLAGEPPA